MSPRPPRSTDEDPTLEDEAPDFGALGTAIDSDEPSLVATGGGSVGAIEHDERGEARWKWVTETAAALETEKTFDHLEALSNASLSLEDAPAKADAAKPSRKTGYNPYDVGAPPSKPRK
ncbi:MAG TPA: hypothetical protein VFV94_05490 [Polyangiaceae bacterium]|nr:hypothetical protein [Polyangiaceae bacterium]